jgi:SAM-dependent methyltransferase
MRDTFLERAKDVLDCENCGSGDLAREENLLKCKSCGYINGKVHQNENRIKHNIDDKKSRNIQYEIEKYNEWGKSAKKNINKGMYKESKPKKDWYEYDLYDKNPNIRGNIDMINGVEDVEGWRILDIGGSLKDSWRFLPAGASCIHQVEPAHESQRAGIQRLESALSESKINWQDKVFFHTTVAENLPFKNEKFELVFSRSSIHHTKRKQSIKECFRVTKNGGYLLIIERRHSNLLNFLTKIYRFIRMKNRGSDKPLTKKDINLIKRLYSSFKELKYNPLGLPGLKHESNINREVNKKSKFYLRQKMFQQSLIVAKK